MINIKLTLLVRVATVVLPLSTVMPQLSTCFAQGNLTPPGPPMPTMKTLNQIEPRVPISSAPFSIVLPDSYYLTTNLTVTSGDAITIFTNNVTLDLNGFTIFSTAPSAMGSGIRTEGELSNITIANGFIRGGVTNSGSGTYGGPGFRYGISGSSDNALVIRVSVSGCLYGGIQFASHDSAVVESCLVRAVGGYGIYASTIKACSATDCGGDAIRGEQVSDCRGQASTGTGVNAFTALNCRGSSSGSGQGVIANTAQNCSGESFDGQGISAGTAQNCHGESVNGTGIEADVAIGCRGESTHGTGVLARVANSCVGSSSKGRAVVASGIANSCYALSGTVSATYKYNMP